MGGGQTPTDYYRFCPGEEQIKISNAICRGRRRSSFPKCHGCPFNDDEKAAAVGPVFRSRAVSAIDDIFQPHEISGTWPSPLSEEAAWRVGHAAAQYLHGKLRSLDRASASLRSVVVGRDTRESSPMLTRALIEGIRSVGLDVLKLPVVDGPQVYFAVNRLQACGGIYVTGGSRPAEYNGFKLCGTKGAAIDEDTGLAGIRDIALRVPRHETGTISRLIDVDVAEEYLAFLRGFLSQEGVTARPLRIVVDAGNGVVGLWLHRILEGNNDVEIVPMNFETGVAPAHVPDPSSRDATAALRKQVKEELADAGVAFNSDASQCTFVDEKGMLISPDILAGLLACAHLERRRDEMVVLDVRSGICVMEEVERAGGFTVLERSGYAAIRKRMIDVNAALGVDLSGRHYFRDYFSCESGFLALVQVLSILGSHDRKFSQLVQPFQRYRSSGEVRLPCEDGDRVLKRIHECYPDARIEHMEGVTVRYPDWGFYLRPSRSDGRLAVRLEARTKKLVDQRLAELESALGEMPE